MEYHDCDLCGSPLTNKKYGLVIEEIVPQEKNLNDFFVDPQTFLSKKQQRIKVYEICDECKQLLKRIFELRKKKIQILKKESDKILRDLL